VPPFEHAEDLLPQPHLGRGLAEELPVVEAEGGQLASPGTAGVDAGDPVGGLRLLDKGEADDKIIAVLKGDAAYGEIREVADLPRTLVERLEHYFLTYKLPPGAAGLSETPIAHGGLYGRAEACEVIERSREDYQILFPDLRDRLLASLRG